MEQIPVIDLFAGPGGLGEGFSAFRVEGAAPFRVALSIEKDPVAQATLELRAFFRQFPQGEAPDDYYHHVRDPRGFPRAALFAHWPREAEAARAEAWQAELGATDPKEIDTQVRTALGPTEPWVLVGGPRRRGINEYDPRTRVSRKSLRILEVHTLPVLVRKLYLS